MTPTRRTFLGGGLAAGVALGAAACGAGSTPRQNGPMPTRHAYGDDRSQFGELTRPGGDSRGTVVVVHGGFWRAEYGLALGRPLAADLSRRGYTAWNIEYRRVGGGGGWPATLADVAAALDLLPTLDVDTAGPVAVGHSAGGQLAAWAAGRAKLADGAPGAAPKLTLRGVVAQAGVLDLRTAARTGVGGSAVSDLLGGSPDDVPERYRDADPIEAVPDAAPVLCVHSRADQNVPYAQSTAYVAAATAAGGRARLHEVEGDHFTLIDPASAAWATVVEALPALASGRLP